MTFTLKNLVLGIAIFILTVSVGVYGISTLYGSSPQYDDFCPYDRPMGIVETQAQCEDLGGKWTSQDIQCIKAPCPQGYCDADYDCRQEYEAAQEPYHKKVFLTALPLGIIIIAIGALVFGLESVGAGLMLGGVGIILYGVGGFWQFTEDWMKFAMSLFGLVIVIWLAYYWNKRMFGKKGK